MDAEDTGGSRVPAAGVAASTTTLPRPRAQGKRPQVELKLEDYLVVGDQASSDIQHVSFEEGVNMANVDKCIAFTKQWGGFIFGLMNHVPRVRDMDVGDRARQVKRKVSLLIERIEGELQLGSPEESSGVDARIMTVLTSDAIVGYVMHQVQNVMEMATRRLIEAKTQPFTPADVTAAVNQTVTRVTEFARDDSVVRQWSANVASMRSLADKFDREVRLAGTGRGDGGGGGDPDDPGGDDDPSGGGGRKGGKKQQKPGSATAAAPGILSGSRTGLAQVLRLAAHQSMIASLTGTVSMCMSWVRSMTRTLANVAAVQMSPFQSPEQLFGVVSLKEDKRVPDGLLMAALADMGHPEIRKVFDQAVSLCIKIARGQELPAADGAVSGAPTAAAVSAVGAAAAAAAAASSATLDVASLSEKARQLEASIRMLNATQTDVVGVGELIRTLFTSIEQTAFNIAYEQVLARTSLWFYDPANPWNFDREEVTGPAHQTAWVIAMSVCNTFFAVLVQQMNETRATIENSMEELQKDRVANILQTYASVVQSMIVDAPTIVNKIGEVGFRGTMEQADIQKRIGFPKQAFTFSMTASTIKILSDLVDRVVKTRREQLAAAMSTQLGLLEQTRENLRAAEEAARTGAAAAASVAAGASAAATVSNPVAPMAPIQLDETLVDVLALWKSRRIEEMEFSRREITQDEVELQQLSIQFERLRRYATEILQATKTLVDTRRRLMEGGLATKIVDSHLQEMQLKLNQNEMDVAQVQARMKLVEEALIAKLAKQAEIAPRTGKVGSLQTGFDSSSESRKDVVEMSVWKGVMEALGNRVDSEQLTDVPGIVGRVVRNLPMTPEYKVLADERMTNVLTAGWLGINVTASTSMDVGTIRTRVTQRMAKVVSNLVRRESLEDSARNRTVIGVLASVLHIVRNEAPAHVTRLEKELADQQEIVQGPIAMYRSFFARDIDRDAGEMLIRQAIRTNTSVWSTDLRRLFSEEDRELTKWTEGLYAHHGVFRREVAPAVIVLTKAMQDTFATFRAARTAWFEPIARFTSVVERGEAQRASAVFAQLSRDEETLLDSWMETAMVVAEVNADGSGLESAKGRGTRIAQLASSTRTIEEKKGTLVRDLRDATDAMSKFVTELKVESEIGKMLLTSTSNAMDVVHGLSDRVGECIQALMPLAPVASAVSFARATEDLLRGVSAIAVEEKAASVDDKKANQALLLGRAFDQLSLTQGVSLYGVATLARHWSTSLTQAIEAGGAELVGYHSVITKVRALSDDLERVIGRRVKADGKRIAPTDSDVSMLDGTSIGDVLTGVSKLTDAFQKVEEAFGKGVDRSETTRLADLVRAWAGWSTQAVFMLNLETTDNDPQRRIHAETTVTTFLADLSNGKYDEKANQQHVRAPSTRGEVNALGAILHLCYREAFTWIYGRRPAWNLREETKEITDMEIDVIDIPPPGGAAPVPMVGEDDEKKDAHRREIAMERLGHGQRWIELGTSILLAAFRIRDSVPGGNLTQPVTEAFRDGFYDAQAPRGPDDTNNLVKWICQAIGHHPWMRHITEAGDAPAITIDPATYNTLLTGRADHLKAVKALSPERRGSILGAERVRDRVYAHTMENPPRFPSEPIADDVKDYETFQKEFDSGAFEYLVGQWFSVSKAMIWKYVRAYNRPLYDRPLAAAAAGAGAVVAAGGGAIAVAGGRGGDVSRTVMDMINRGMRRTFLTPVDTSPDELKRIGEGLEPTIGFSLPAERIEIKAPPAPADGGGFVEVDAADVAGETGTARAELVKWWTGLQVITRITPETKAVASATSKATDTLKESLDKTREATKRMVEATAELRKQQAKYREGFGDAIKRLGLVLAKLMSPDSAFAAFASASGAGWMHPAAAGGAAAGAGGARAVIGPAIGDNTPVASAAIAMGAPGGAPVIRKVPLEPLIGPRSQQFVRDSDKNQLFLESGEDLFTWVQAFADTFRGEVMDVYSSVEASWPDTPISDAMAGLSKTLTAFDKAVQGAGRLAREIARDKKDVAELDRLRGGIQDMRDAMRKQPSFALIPSQPDEVLKYATNQLTEMAAVQGPDGRGGGGGGGAGGADGSGGGAGSRTIARMVPFGMIRSMVIAAAVAPNAMSQFTEWLLLLQGKAAGALPIRQFLSPETSPATALPQNIAVEWQSSLEMQMFLDAARQQLEASSRMQALLDARKRELEQREDHESPEIRAQIGLYDQLLGLAQWMRDRSSKSLRDSADKSRELHERFGPMLTRFAEQTIDYDGLFTLLPLVVDPTIFATLTDVLMFVSTIPGDLADTTCRPEEPQYLKHLFKKILMDGIYLRSVAEMVAVKVQMKTAPQLASDSSTGTIPKRKGAGKTLLTHAAMRYEIKELDDRFAAYQQAMRIRSMAVWQSQHGGREWTERRDAWWKPARGRII